MIQTLFSSFLLFVIVMSRSILILSQSPDPLPSLDEWKTWSREELEKQMTPSSWVENKTKEEAIQQYIRIGQQGTKKAREILAHEINVPYGSLPSEKYDVYGTDLEKNSSVFFWIHGGYWQEGSKDISGHFAIFLNKLKYKTIVFGYTLAPNASIEQMEDELVHCLNSTLENYPDSPFIIGGHSAGAQLASSLLIKDISTVPRLKSQVKGFLFVSGVYDLRPLVNTTVNEPLHLTEQSAQNLSALFNQVHPSFADLKLRNQIMLGNHESPEFKRQSQGYNEQLKGVLPTDYWISLDDDHFSIVENFANETSDAGEKLKSFLLHHHRSNHKLLQFGGRGSATILTGISSSLFLNYILLLTFLL